MNKYYPQGTEEISERITNFLKEYPTQEYCIKLLEKVRWGDTPRCPYCSSTNTVPNQHRHRCYTCKKSFSVTVGTIFHRTHLHLQQWFVALILIWRYEERATGSVLLKVMKINKNTASRVVRQVRKAMNEADMQNLLYDILEEIY